MKVDTQIEDNWRQTAAIKLQNQLEQARPFCVVTLISYLQGYSCPKLQLQQTEWSETYGEYSSQYKKNNFMLNAGQD